MSILAGIMVAVVVWYAFLWLVINFAIHFIEPTLPAKIVVVILPILVGLGAGFWVYEFSK